MERKQGSLTKIILNEVEGKRISQRINKYVYWSNLGVNAMIGTIWVVAAGLFGYALRLREDAKEKEKELNKVIESRKEEE